MIRILDIENFKSIRQQSIELRQLNIMVGPNGSGKSNLISFFKFLERLSDQQLNQYVFQSGGINNFLFKGYEVSSYLLFKLQMSESPESVHTNLYECVLSSDGENYRFEQETIGYWDESQYQTPFRLNLEKGNRKREADIKKHRDAQLSKVAMYIYGYLRNLKVFHFHDTSDNAQVKLPQPMGEVYDFKSEAENLAPLLLHFKEQHFKTYWRIVETIRLVYPLFHDFVLEESPASKGNITLRWQERGGDQVFDARQISDGTLRFICLAVLLIQPPDSTYVPQTIVLDEPELGLHPFAIRILAELLQKAAREKQIVLATQSVSLINHFRPEDLLIVERNEQGASVFKRLKNEDFADWLEDYSLGQLWERNFLGGRP